ncbi:natural cytotoxicity triggering receptor 3 ligand 1 [Coturnix japonica]|uniref:Uncharacterized LOC107313135 n=1 Tax=Coturnix japonica TaxID=93934 RepID=A0A8C2SQN3_COTJA|nr:natural cytotoxicity triggering receptor 3 ligand 1 [Coturnix japonica]
MGGSQGKEVPERTPLGCILAHWRDIAGKSRGTLSRKTLIKYCNQWWLVYKLEDGEKWPLNGTVNYNTLLQLMLFLRRESKWDEAAYADMFFTLRNHPEWQKECGMGPPQDPFVLTVEKERCETGESKIKRCCSSCSIGQQCTKTGKVREPEELSEYLQAPWAAGAIGEEAPLERSPEVPPLEHPPLPPDPPVPPAPSAPPASPVASQTLRQQQQPLVIAPLREMVGPRGIILVRVPFSLPDLESWREICKNYRDDPLKVARHLQFIIRQHDPDWDDIQLLLDQLTETEKQLVLKTAQTLTEDSLQGTNEDIKDHFPLQNPRWDPNTKHGRELLERYREWVIKGVERAIPRTVNWSKLFEVKQGPQETPSEFLERLRNVMRKHTSLDPRSEEGIQQLVSLFTGQSAGDVRRKLQKLRAPASWNLESLLEEAWRVFSNREEVDNREDRKVLMTALQETRKGGMNKVRKPLEKDQCALCRKKGLWKNECPLRKQKEKGGAWNKIQAPVEKDC